MKDSDGTMAATLEATFLTVHSLKHLSKLYKFKQRFQHFHFLMRWFSRQKKFFLRIFHTIRTGLVFPNLNVTSLRLPIFASYTYQPKTNLISLNIFLE